MFNDGFKVNEGVSFEIIELIAEVCDTRMKPMK